MKLKTHSYILFLIGTYLLFSCDFNRIFDEYKPIENHQWSSKNRIHFLVTNTDTITSRNVFINIRNNKNYQFSTLFLIAKIEFPSGYNVVDTLEYEMTNAFGEWLGTGFTDIKENKLFYKEQVVFSEKGTYKFTIQHATRSINDIEGTKALQGITDVGLRIEKVE
jgi:gliding motility-associated lipoprotein GldH